MARIFRRALRSEQSGRCKYVGGAYSKFPDIHVEILDLIAADDKVVVRNRWAGTEAATGKEFQFSGMADRAPATGGTLGVPDAATASEILVRANRAARARRHFCASRRCKTRCVHREGRQVLRHL